VDGKIGRSISRELKEKFMKKPVLVVLDLDKK